MTMQIRSSEIICGLPALEARKLMCDLWRRQIGIRVMDLPWLTGCHESDAPLIMTDLVREGYLEPPEPGFDRYTGTDKARSLAAASAVGGYKRNTCQAALDGFLARADDLNRNPWMPFYVERIALFGSFLSDKEKPGDVDLMVLLSHRYQGEGELQRKVEKHRTDLAWARGKYLYDAIYYSWGWDEAWMLLKKRSPVLSLQPHKEEFLRGIPHKYLGVKPPLRVSPSELVPAGSDTVLYWGETATSLREQALVLICKAFVAMESEGVLAWRTCRGTADLVVGHLLRENRLRGYPCQDAFFWTVDDQKSFEAGGCMTIRHLSMSGPKCAPVREARVGWRTTITAALHSKGIPVSWLRLAGDDVIEVHPALDNLNY